MKWDQDGISVCEFLPRAVLYLLLVLTQFLKGISIASQYPRISWQESQILKTGHIPLPPWNLQVVTL
jgi:hypothetical protein